jgi:hypothetical protein
MSNIQYLSTKPGSEIIGSPIYHATTLETHKSNRIKIGKIPFTLSLSAFDESLNHTITSPTLKSNQIVPPIAYH